MRTVNGFVFPRDRGLECASPKYRRRNSVIIIASLLEYKRAPAMPLPTLTSTTVRTTDGRRGVRRGNNFLKVKISKSEHSSQYRAHFYPLPLFLGV